MKEEMGQNEIFFLENEEAVYTGVQLRDWKGSGEPVQELGENLPA